MPEDEIISLINGEALAQDNNNNSSLTLISKSLQSSTKYGDAI